MRATPARRRWRSAATRSLGAAKIIELVNKIALDRAPVAVGTVGMVNVHPNSRNVIPGRVFLAVDFRHPDDDVLKGMGEALEKGVAEICTAMKLDKKLEQIFYYAPTHFDEACVGLVRQAAEDLGYAHRDIVSGAGHDACYIAQVAPTAMVFCPCKDGISHNEVEDITQGLGHGRRQRAAPRRRRQGGRDRMKRIYLSGD